MDLGITREQGLHLWRQMLRVRRMEEACAELYTNAKIRGFLHLYIGQEASGVGVLEQLGPDDAVVATCDYGGPVVAAVEYGPVWATQFHPEKSSDAGLRMLANFVAAVGVRA